MRSLLTIAARRSPVEQAPSAPSDALRDSVEKTHVYGEAPPVATAPVVPRPPRRSITALSLADVEAVLAAKVADEPDTASRIVDMLCLVAAADGNVDEAERDVISRMLGVLMHNTVHVAVTLHLIRGSLRDIERDGVTVRLHAVADALRGCHAVEEGLLVAIGMAYASNGLSIEERSIIEALAEAFEVSPARLEALIERVRVDLDPVPHEGGE